MKRSDVDECLEILWHLKENHESNMDNFIEHDSENFGSDAVFELERNGYLEFRNGNIAMTRKGEETAMQIVRRHRLAERLLTDVLGMKPDEIEEGACEFEHMLAPELTESICTLLGHPRLCPHGTKIPEGDCCRTNKNSVSCAAVSLLNVNVMQDYEVAYINTKLEERMQKLFHFNVKPGSIVRISQKYPSIVILCGESMLAMEEDVAKEIYVWRNGKSKGIQ